MSTAAPKILVLLLLALLCGRRAAAQTVVNLNFRENGGTAYSGQGAYVDVPGHTFWNEVTRSTVGVGDGSNFTASNFLTSDGSTPSGITFSVSGAFGLFTGYDTGFANTDLFNQFLVSPLYMGVASFTIGGLTPNQTYAFYFYGHAGDNMGLRPITFTLEGDTLNLTSAGESSFVLGDNYGVLQYTTSGTSVSGTFGKSIGSNADEGDFNGLQIVAIPEPSADVVIGGAMALYGVGLLRWRGRRRASA